MAGSEFHFSALIVICDQKTHIGRDEITVHFSLKGDLCVEKFFIQIRDDALRIGGGESEALSPVDVEVHFCDRHF